VLPCHLWSRLLLSRLRLPPRGPLMRKAVFFLLAAIVSLATTDVARAASLDVEFTTQYCNETLQTAELAVQPQLLRNIEGSKMTFAPDYLEAAVYLRRRTN